MNKQSLSRADTRAAFAARFAFVAALAAALVAGLCGFAGTGRAFAAEDLRTESSVESITGVVAVPGTSVLEDVCDRVAIQTQAVVSPGEAIASVFHDGATTYYDTFDSAIEAAVTGDTVTLLHSAVSDVVVDKSITLNLGGMALIGTGYAGSMGSASGFGDYAVAVGVTADNVVISNGTIRSKSGTVACIGIAASGSSLTLDRIAVESSGEGVVAKADSRVTLSNVAVAADSATGAVVADGSELVLNAATVVNGNGEGGFGVYATGASTVVVGDSAAVSSRDVAISAHVPAEGYSAVYVDDASSATINGGLFCTDVDVASGRFSFAVPYAGLTQIDASDAEDGGKWCLAVDCTVTFLDEDGETVLASASYPLNTAVAAIAQPAPSKADSDGYKYYFNGWSPDLSVVTRDATYTARYAAKRDLAYADVAVGSAVYSGSPLEPALVVSFDYGQEVVPAEAYEVAYSDNVNAGVDAGTVAIAAKDDAADYAGSTTARFTIDKRPTVAAADPKALTLSFGSTGTIVVSGDHVGDIRNVTGAIDSVATVSAAGNQITVKPVGIGSFALVASASAADGNHADPDGAVVTVTVAAAVLTGDMVEVASPQKYTGKQVKPEVTVKYNGLVVAPENYSVTYGDNVSVDDGGTVTVTGEGPLLTGTVTKAFEIVGDPAPGPDPEPGQDPQPEPGPGSDPQPEPGSDPQPEPGSDPQPTPDPGSQPDPQPEPDPAPAPEPEPDAPSADPAASSSSAAAPSSDVTVRPSPASAASSSSAAKTGDSLPLVPIAVAVAVALAVVLLALVMLRRSRSK